MIMKKYVLLVAFSCILLALKAQTGIDYKAIIKDDNGNVVANTTIEIRFKIQQLNDTIYEESHSPTTDNNGIIAVFIGEGNPIAGNFTDIQWEQDDHFLNVQVDIGNGLIDLGTTQFKPVPYAIIAEKSMSSNESQTNAIVTFPRYLDYSFTDFSLISGQRVRITIDFNIQMDPSSFVNGSNFIVSGLGGTATGTFSWSLGNTRLIFTTDQDFIDLAPCFSGGLQLQIIGNGINPVEDNQGKPIDGDRDGKTGGNFTVTFDIVC